MLLPISTRGHLGMLHEMLLNLHWLLLLVCFPVEIADFFFSFVKDIL